MEENATETAVVQGASVTALGRSRGDVVEEK